MGKYFIESMTVHGISLLGVFKQRNFSTENMKVVSMKNIYVENMSGITPAWS